MHLLKKSVFSILVFTLLLTSGISPRVPASRPESFRLAVAACCSTASSSSATRHLWESGILLKAIFHGRNLLEAQAVAQLGNNFSETEKGKFLRRSESLNANSQVDVKWEILRKIANVYSAPSKVNTLQGFATDLLNTLIRFRPRLSRLRLADHVDYPSLIEVITEGVAHVVAADLRSFSIEGIPVAIQGPDKFLIGLSGIGRGSQRFVAVLDNFYVKDAYALQRYLSQIAFFLSMKSHIPKPETEKNAEIPDP